MARRMITVAIKHEPYRRAMLASVAGNSRLQGLRNRGWQPAPKSGFPDLSAFATCLVHLGPTLGILAGLILTCRPAPRDPTKDTGASSRLRSPVRGKTEVASS
jgi:hypothetical protein